MPQALITLNGSTNPILDGAANTLVQLDNTNIGGNYLVLLGAEYSYPLIGENVRGHVFLDTGTAGAGTYRASIGVGIRLIINVLGPIPLEFNLAAPISSDGEDDEQVFSFLIGSLF